MGKKLGAVLFVFGFFAFVSAQTLTLDEAIGESIKYFSTKLAAGTKIVVLNIESDSKNLSDYVVEECGVFAVNNTKLSLVSKSGLPGVLKEKNIGDLNEIDETAALEIAKKLGAASVISGSIFKVGENYRFRVQAVNTANGQVVGMQSINVKQDEILSDLLAMGGVSPTKNAEFNDLSSVKAGGGLGDSQSARARLEAEMSSKSGANESQNPISVSITVEDTSDESDLYVSTTPSEQNKPIPANISKPKVEEKSYFWLSAKFQRYFSYFPSDHSYYVYDYDSHVVKPGSFDLEIGGIRPSGFTFYGIANYGPGNFGGGFFLGRTFFAGKVFRFTSGTDLGTWGINTQSLEEGFDVLGKNITYGRVRENIMFGGSNINFLLGYNPVFVSLGFKVLAGVYFEDDMARSYDSKGNYLGLAVSYGKTGLTFMYSWNIGLTFTF